MTMTIRCRTCRGPHLTITCPLRPANQRPKTWKQQNDDYTRKAEAKPYQCVIPIKPGKKSHVYADDIDEFWKEIQVSVNHSLYRDSSGVQLFDNDSGGVNELVPFNSRNLPPGKYRLVSQTHTLSNEDLARIIAKGVETLKEQRPLQWDAVRRVQSDHLLLYNHFSLSHEGNSMTLDETRVIFDLMMGNDWKHKVEKDELTMKMMKASKDSSENDVKEARNHIFVSEQLPQLSRQDITETLILQLHAWVMSGLLVKADEGLPGEYRKVAIGVEGSTIGRPPFTDVPPLMKRFFEVSMIQKEEENLIEYLARIHTEFQHIHPFRDGNGRIGRLIINLILMKHGYPVLVLPTTLSSMFNHAVDMGTHNKLDLFTRLLGEAIFKSLLIYEDALQGVKLVPRVDEMVGLRVIDCALPRVVSP